MSEFFFGFVFPMLMFLIGYWAGYKDGLKRYWDGQ